jgi:hypothetical protein
MTGRTRTRLAITSAILLAGSAVPAGTAANAVPTGSEAGPLTAPVAPTVEKRPQHCVKNLPSQKTECFSSFSDAMAHATGGRTAHYRYPANQGQAVKDPAFIALVNSASARGASSSTTTEAVVTIGTEYEHDDYLGDSLSHTASSGCDSNRYDVDWMDNSLVDQGWDNKSSSYKGFSGCRVRHWQYGTFGGEVLQACWSPPTNFFCQTHADMSTVDFDNRTSSIQWS